MRKRQVVLLHIAQRAASPGAELPQLLLLARHPQPRTHLRRTEAGEGECPGWQGGEEEGRGVVVEEQGSERMWLDEACGLSQSTRATSRGRSENERRGTGRTSGAWRRWRRLGGPNQVVGEVAGLIRSTGPTTGADGQIRTRQRSSKAPAMASSGFIAN